jgi:hypothetical protein
VTNCSTIELPDRAWLYANEPLRITIIEDSTLGYGADHTRRYLDIYILERTAPAATLVQVTTAQTGRERGVPKPRASSVAMSRATTDALLRALRDATRGSAVKQGDIIMTGSDVYRYTEVQVVSLTGKKAISFFSDTNDRVPPGWWWRGQDLATELVPDDIERTVHTLLDEAEKATPRNP